MDKIRNEHSQRIKKIKELKSIIDRCEGNIELGEKKQRTIEQHNDLIKNPLRHNLYIFGHSLDVTDKDILRNLILNHDVHTTIYYLNKDMMGKQIVNFVKVIGQDELIRKTSGSTKMIKFKLQEDMIGIEDSTMKVI